MTRRRIISARRCINRKFAGAALLAFAVLLASVFPARAGVQEPRRLCVAIFPTENHTGIEVWESKYYPQNVLEQKMTEYLASLLYSSPLVDVMILDEAGMNRWLNQPHRMEDMAVQMELYSATLKEREIAGTLETGSVAMRLKIFDAVNGERFATRNIGGQDRRYTFKPGDDGLYWIDTMLFSLPLPFKDGLDVLGLTRTAGKGQKMSRPTWQQFSGTSHWQTVKNAIGEAYVQTMAHVGTALDRNNPDAEGLGDPGFSPSFVTVGRIISPTSQSTRKRREYIISIGADEAILVGDILDVARSEAYMTVDPENPVSVLPRMVGKVRVISVEKKNAVVRVIQENKKEPVQLKDLVFKRIGPKEIRRP